jgi:hypothetical protein
MIGKIHCRSQEGIMADPKGAKATQVVDGADVHVRNTISMAMEDLMEEDRKTVEWALEEEKVEAGMLPKDAWLRR